jgi:alkylation response protein AidB-like acyl-CoA dehydrogenase
VDFRFDPETERFRAEVRTFLADAMADAREHADSRDLTGLDPEYERVLHRRAGERGWLKLTGERRAVLEYEVALADAPLIDTAMTLAGHAIASFGSAQHVSLLAQMVSGETGMCIAYTEAGAGSDLSAIETTAVPDGDHWVLSGRKVLVTAASKADWCLTIARTASEATTSAAFTMFIVDMRARGARVDPRPTMNGWMLGDIAFENVRLGADAVVGEIGAGWRQMAAAVNAERSGMFWLGFAQHVLDLLVDHVRGAARLGSPLVFDPIARDAVGRCAVEVAAVERLARRSLWTTLTTGADPALNAMVKIASTELLQVLAQTATELSGQAGTVWAPLFGTAPSGAAGGGRFAWEYLERVHGTISVGANELQRDTVAALALGLTGAAR